MLQDFQFDSKKFVVAHKTLTNQINFKPQSILPTLQHNICGRTRSSPKGISVYQQIDEFGGGGGGRFGSFSCNGI